MKKLGRKFQLMNVNVESRKVSGIKEQGRGCRIQESIRKDIQIWKEKR